MRFSSSVSVETDGNDQINVLSAEQELRLVNIWDNVTRELNQQGFCEVLIFSAIFPRLTAAKRDVVNLLHVVECGRETTTFVFT